MKKLIASALALVVAGAVPALAQTVTNGSFESPNVGSGGGAYVYNPTVAGVTFNAGSGVQANGSDWGFANAPDGNQTAFIQSGSDYTGQITFNLADLIAGKSYYVDFFASARPRYANNAFTVAVDEAVLGTFAISTEGWNSYSTPLSFVATGSTAALSFIGSPTTNGDNDVGLDRVSLSAVPEPATWAMMLVGFGMVGFGLRARRQTAKASFA